MSVSLELSIERMTAISLRPPPQNYPPPREESFMVCPKCQREVTPVFVQCDGHVFPGDGQCVEHGSVIPMNSAVVHTHPYQPDGSAA